MENFLQNMMAAQAHLYQQATAISPSSSSSETTDIKPQLGLMQINWLMQKIYQEQLMLLQKLQKVASDVAPPSPPGSTIAAEEHHPTTIATHPEDTGTVVEDYTVMPAMEELVVPKPEPIELAPTRAAAGPKRVEATVKLRFKPYELRRPKAGVFLSALEVTEPLEVELKYHKNMARWYSATAGGTPEQRERRLRNTEAARLSRAKARALRTLLADKFEAATMLNRKCKIEVAQKRVYVGKLLALLGLPARDLSAEWEKVKETGDVSHGQHMSVISEESHEESMDQ